VIGTFLLAHGDIATLYGSLAVGLAVAAVAHHLNSRQAAPEPRR
jgi:hypothetical protein